MTAAILAAAVICSQPISTKDGDNVLCGDLDLRIEGVNARELDGTCRRRSPCPSMSGREARLVLADLVTDGFGYTVSYEDRYGRPVVNATLADGRDLACALIAAGAAVRWDRYWPKGKSCE